MEVLAGARDDRRGTDLRRLQLRSELLGFDTVSDFDGAPGSSAVAARLG